MSFDSATLCGITEDLLRLASAKGATAAEAGLSVEQGLSVTVRMGEVETIEHNRDKSLGVTVYLGKRKGSASTTDFTGEALEDTVQAAMDIARYTEEDQYAGLIDPAYLAMDYPDLDLYHPWELNAEQAIDMARRGEAVALQYDKRVTNSEGAYVTTHSGYRVYANSHGFLGHYPSTRHSCGCTVIASENERMERDYWYSLGRTAEQLEDFAAIGEKAAQRAVSRLGARKIKTQKLPVIFTAEVARGLLGHLIRSISGGALYRNASFMVNRLGDLIFPQYITVDERPHLPGAIGSAPFDSEGAINRAHAVVNNGKLESYVLDSYAARRLGMEPTGNAGGVHNLFIRDSGKDLDTLLKDMHRGLLITEVMGQGVNIVTGDYSRGAAGFYVDNGTIQYPVEEFTLASNLARMFQQLIAVGNDIDARSSMCTGSWLISEMTVAGS